MGKIIAITAGKGGSGKTALTAMLGLSLARQGKNVCLVDLCLGMRGLDMALGLQDQVVYDLFDLAQDECAMEQALLKSAQSDNLHLVAAPQQEIADGLGERPLRRALERLQKRFDAVLLDTPDVLFPITQRACALADEMMLITLPGPCGERNAERAAALLHEKSSAPLSLIVNCYDKRLAASGKASAPDALSAYLDAPLIGLIPFSEEMRVAGLCGAVDAYPDRTMAAADEIAQRLSGKDIPLKIAVRRFPWRSLIEK